MTLKEQLDALRSSAMVGARREGYEAVLEHLGKGELAEHALKAGDSMPPFLLPDTAGRLVSSDDLLAEGPLVVTFFRGEWCPYCALTLGALAQALPRIEAAGARLVALTFELGATAEASHAALGPALHVLCDVDGAVGLQFGVTFIVPEAYRRLLENAGIDLAARHGQAAWLLPVPATFVVDRAGIIRRAFVDVDFTHRAEPAEIVEFLERLVAKP
jgi:peroxiredoxin